MRRAYAIVLLTSALALPACTQKTEEPAKKAAPVKKAAEGGAEKAGAEAEPAGGEEAAAGMPESVSTQAMAEAEKIYGQRCQTCHGPKGAGDGPAAAALNPKPRTLKSPEWQKSVTDDHLYQVILKGGEAVGLSNLMPPNPDLEDQPEVVGGLVKLVRGFEEAS